VVHFCSGAHTTTDAKAEELLDLIYRLQQEESDPDLKLLIFTEFVPSQDMLQDFLTQRGFSVACLNGSMALEARKQVLQDFAGKVRILVSTDAGGEGLNLQFCHVVVNFDIPWNPMRLEQRIGRVDRIGQTHVVRALNLVLEDTVEFRVREVLEQKLAVILREFGVDKTGDVLDSADAAEIFDGLYRDTNLDPTLVESKVSTVLTKIRIQAEAMHKDTSLLAQTKAVSPSEAQRLLGHPLPYWVETMTVNYITSAGGTAERGNAGWKLSWPDGTKTPSAVFTLGEATRHPVAIHLTLDDARIQSLISNLPCFVPGQAIPTIALSGISQEIQGYWSLWTVAIRDLDSFKERMLVVFTHDDGRLLSPTARQIWMQLLDRTPTPKDYITGDSSINQHANAMSAAEDVGRALFEEMMRLHRSKCESSGNRTERTFASRRRAIERVGLSAVRQHRLNELDQEERRWRIELTSRRMPHPELTPRLLLRVEGIDHV
jgi:hypothetical protein